MRRKMLRNSLKSAFPDDQLKGEFFQRRPEQVSLEDFVQVTLKIISDEINEIIQTFRRYDYKIVSNHENDIYLDDLKNRSEYLQKYLEM